MKGILTLLLLSLTMTCSFGQTPYGDYRVLVDVTGNGFSHNTQVYFDDESWDPQNPPTYSWDPCCDAQLILGASNRPHIFTEVVEPPAPTPNYRLSLNGLPHLFEQTDVPLGFLPGTLAQYTFSFTHLYTLPQGVTVELEDVTQNVTQDLLLDSMYTTWGAPSDNEARFIIHFYPSEVTGGENDLSREGGLSYRRIGTTIQVEGAKGSEIDKLIVFDLCGREVWSMGLDGGWSDEIIVDMSGFASGVYVFMLQSTTGEVRIDKVRY